MSTDQVQTGPPMMDLRWGQLDAERDGTHERSFRPKTAYQEARGYLHPGILAAAVLDAVRTSVGLPTPVRSVSLAMHRLVPLGGELRTVVEQTADDTIRVEIHHHGDAGTEDDPIDLLAVGEVHAGTPESPPNLGELRSLADVPVPDPEEHDLYAGCFVCGQDNPQGLNLQPGWHAPDTVVNGFIANERMGEEGFFSPELTAAILSCPTLWANRDELDAADAAGAVLTDYEVTFLRDARLTATLRTAGLAGGRSGDRLRGSSVLLGEDGELYAVAQASWELVDRVPERDPGRPAPASEYMPLKGGRAERSPEDEGQPLPGRREAPGPRSERPGDHDDRRSMDLPHRSTGPSSTNTSADQPHGP